MSEHEFIPYEKKPFPKNVAMTGAVLTALGLIGGLAAYFSEPVRASYNLIMLLMFISSVGLGSLFIVALEYLAGGVWSTPFRRISEIFAVVLFVAPFIAIVGFLNLQNTFIWTHTAEVVKNPGLTAKSPYLNTTFFIIRNLALFAVMLLFYFILTGNSKKQDKTGNQKLTKMNIKFSAAFMPVFAISLTILAIDWLMSLQPAWYSTIFGVYYFAGSFLVALACLTYAVVRLNEKGLIAKGLVPDHYYSLGALLFGFTNFWAYIAFSQFLLIWYANLPEETVWFIGRWEGSWKFLSLGIILVRFIVPYILLLSQPSKMNPKRLKFASLWIIFSHFYDLYWLIMPSFSRSGIAFGWVEIAFIVLTLGIIILVFGLAAKNRNLVPVGDPKLKRGLEFRL